MIESLKAVELPAILLAKANWPLAISYLLAISELSVLTNKISVLSKATSSIAYSELPP